MNKVVLVFCHVSRAASVIQASPLSELSVSSKALLLNEFNLKMQNKR